MALSPSTAELVDSLEQYSNTVSWINDTLHAFDDDDSSQPVTELTELDQHITRLVATLDIACEDTSSQIEHIIDGVSRSVPRLTYDLHFMKDSASSLQTTLTRVLQKSKEAVPQATSKALDHLRRLDTVKSHMEAAREVLREAESWSSLELEVTSLLAERSYAKAAERLSEASRSMVVFQNTPEYEPRRALMVNLQNQLEASLSSALVVAINMQDVVACRSYFFIFSNIQREAEFRNYYNASRRTSIVTMWHNAPLLDCDSAAPPFDVPSQTFSDFLPKFYGNFLALLNLERVSIPAIFPDPTLTLSAFISSSLSSLQPTFSQRLSSLSMHRGESALCDLIILLRLTEEFATGVDKVIDKIKYTALSPTSGVPNLENLLTSNSWSHSRRHSTRMSISWRPGAHVSTSSVPANSIMDVMEWDQELFQPFLDFQVDYGTLEKRILEHALHRIITSGTKDRHDTDRARLLRERAVDIFAAAEESLARCTNFTHGYGSVGLVRALDNFFQSFIDIWTADVRMESSNLTTLVQNSASDDDLSDMDYSAQDWSDFQLSLHLLSSARAVYERISTFETKLRSNLVQTATRFRLARNDPTNFTITVSRGQNHLLEQSPLNSAELHTLLRSVETDMYSRESASAGGFRHNQTLNQPGPTEPLLVDARRAVFTFANTCQVSLQRTILSPLRKHLTSYASSPLWSATGDPKSKHTVTANELRVPDFSLSPSDTVQRVAEGLLNLPRLFEVYAVDDALSFSLHTLPHVDPETLKGLPEQAGSEVPTQPTHTRRSSLSATKSIPVDPDTVSSAWLSSLGHTLLEHLTSSILPSIAALSTEGAAQLVSDLEYLSNIVRALNVEFPELDKWKEYSEMDDEEGRNQFSDGNTTDRVLQNIARLRGWDK